MNLLKKMIRKIYKLILWILPKEKAHKFLYYRIFHKKLDLKNPIDFNEKIQYLIVNKYGKNESILSDKYLVKEYVQDLNIEKLLIPKTIRIYENADDIKKEDLPNNFVLKCNHGSGNVFVCNDKSKFDLDKAKKILNENLKQNFAKQNLEYHYKYINPVIILEEYLNDGLEKNPVDYKFYVFNGKCDRILVCSDRNKKLRLDDYDLNWIKMDDTLEKYKSKKNIDKPVNLNDMISIAEKLCKKNNKVVIPFARVDLYNINGKIYFGEYTFTPACGLIQYYNQNTLNELGDKLDLNNYEKER